MEDELIRELESDIQACSRSAQRNYLAAYFLLVLALIATAAAAFLAASDAAPAVRAVAAAVPGLIGLALGSLKLQEKSRYCWIRVRRFQGLARKLKYEGVPAADVSRELSQIWEQLETEWPGFDTQGFTPPT